MLTVCDVRNNNPQPTLNSPTCFPVSAAVDRFAKTLTSVDKKKPKTAFGAGRGSSIANTSALLSHLKIRSKK